MNLKCLFGHKWKFVKTFERKLYRKTTWKGLQCTRCDNRKIEKTENYECFNGAESDREACEWLNQIPIPINPIIKILHRVDD